MPFPDVLVHTGTPIRYVQPDEPGEGEWVDGEWVPSGGGDPATPVRATPFNCVLFLPPSEETPGGGNTVVLGGKTVRRPTLLYGPRDRFGAYVALGPEDEVGVVAPELNRGQGRPENEEVVWYVDGEPQPFGRPGSELVGFRATLKRVRD